MSKIAIYLTLALLFGLQKHNIFPPREFAVIIAHLNYQLNGQWPEQYEGIRYE